MTTLLGPIEFLVIAHHLQIDHRADLIETITQVQVAEDVQEADQEVETSIRVLNVVADINDDS